MLLLYHEFLRLPSDNFLTFLLVRAISHTILRIGLGTHFRLFDNRIKKQCSVSHDSVAGKSFKLKRLGRRCSMSATLFFILAVLGVGLVLVSIAVSTAMEKERWKRKIAEQNWELPGQWGAQTTVQRDTLYELREWRRRVSQNDSEYYNLPDHFFKELELASIKIRDYDLDPQLLTELARAVHTYYAERRLWNHAAQVAKKYNL